MFSTLCELIGEKLAKNSIQTAIKILIRDPLLPSDEFDTERTRHENKSLSPCGIDIQLSNFPHMVPGTGFFVRPSVHSSGCLAGSALDFSPHQGVTNSRHIGPIKTGHKNGKQRNVTAPGFARSSSDLIWVEKSSPVWSTPGEILSQKKLLRTY